MAHTKKKHVIHVTCSETNSFVHSFANSRRAVDSLGGGGALIWRELTCFFFSRVMLTLSGDVRARRSRDMSYSQSIERTRTVWTVMAVLGLWFMVRAGGLSLQNLCVVLGWRRASNTAPPCVFAPAPRVKHYARGLSLCGKALLCRQCAAPRRTLSRGLAVAVF